MGPTGVKGKQKQSQVSRAAIRPNVHQADELLGGRVNRSKPSGAPRLLGRNRSKPSGGRNYTNGINGGAPPLQAVYKLYP